MNIILVIFAVAFLWLCWTLAVEERKVRKEINDKLKEQREENE